MFRYVWRRVCLFMCVSIYACVLVGVCVSFTRAPDVVTADGAHWRRRRCRRVVPLQIRACKRACPPSPPCRTPYRAAQMPSGPSVSAAGFECGVRAARHLSFGHLYGCKSSSNVGVRVFGYIFMCACAGVCTCVRVCMRVRACISVYLYVSMYVRMGVYAEHIGKRGLKSQ